MPVQTNIIAINLETEISDRNKAISASFETISGDNFVRKEVGKTQVLLIGELVI